MTNREDPPTSILKIPKDKVVDNRPYRTETELAGKIDNLIHEYDGMISSVAVIGILEIIKSEIIDGSYE